MSDDVTDIEDEDLDTTTPDAETPLVKQLRKQLAQQSKKANSSTKELAFLKSGVPQTALESAVGAKFLKHYDGELTPDAVRAGAVEWGLAGVTAPDAIDADEAAQIAAVQAASSAGGGQPPKQGTTYADFEAMSKTEQMAFVQAHPDSGADFAAGKTVL